MNVYSSPRDMKDVFFQASVSRKHLISWSIMSVCRRKDGLWALGISPFSEILVFQLQYLIRINLCSSSSRLVNHASLVGISDLVDFSIV